MQCYCKTNLLVIFVACCLVWSGDIYVTASVSDTTYLGNEDPLSISLINDKGAPLVAMLDTNTINRKIKVYIRTLMRETIQNAVQEQIQDIFKTSFDENSTINFIRNMTMQGINDILKEQGQVKLFDSIRNEEINEALKSSDKDSMVEDIMYELQGQGWPYRVFILQTKNTSCSLYARVNMEGYETDDIFWQALDSVEETIDKGNIMIQKTCLYQFNKEICLPENHNISGKDIKKDTQNILNNMEVYKEIVQMKGKLKEDIKLILTESGGEKQVSEMLRMLTRDVKASGVCTMQTAKDCSELQKYISHSDVYPIYPDESEAKVYCDMTTDGGGWTIIQRRLDGSVNFQRNWKDYENGFGNVDGEYWLGNKHIHSLTSSGKYELRIDLTDMSNTKTYAVYKKFVVGDAASKYKLTVGDYSGDAGDKMSYHNGMKFSTTDQDNDQSSGGKCADTYGPWWHKDCCHSGLNKSFKSSLYWGSFKSSSAKTSVMMIRQL